MKSWQNERVFMGIDVNVSVLPLVFGCGHVVLPLIERKFVPTGWLSEEEFSADYCAAQAVPGPLFTFVAYIGAVLGG
jgi:chromate transporter